MKRRVCVVLSAVVGSLFLTVISGPLPILSGSSAAEAADCRYTSAPMVEYLLKNQFSADRAAAGVPGGLITDRSLLPLSQDRALRRMANQKVMQVSMELGARNHRFTQAMGFTASGDSLAALHDGTLSTDEGRAAIMTRGADRIAISVLRARAEGCVPLVLEGLVRGL